MKRQHYGVTLAVLAVAGLSFALLQTMVAPALPAIQREYGASTTAVTWVLTVYLLTASIATPVLGRLGDMFGKERLLVIVLLVLAAGTVVAALSHSLEVLIAGRAIQGAGGAIFPLAFGIIRDEFPRERVGAGIGLISATFGIGGGAGLVLAGVIVDHLDYTWIFWLSLVVILGAVVATHFFVPESPVKTPARVDWGGAALLAGGLASGLIAVSEGNNWGWGSAPVLGLLALSALLLVVWGRYELRVREPLVDMRMMRMRGVWTTNVTALMVGFGMFGSFLLVPQLVQLPESTGFGFGASVTQAGLFLLPSSAVMLFAGPFAGWLGARFGSRTPVLIGIALVALVLRPARAAARRALAHLPQQRPRGRRHRPLVRRDGDADRRGRPADADRRRHRDEHDHALGRRRARRPDQRQHRRRPPRRLRPAGRVGLRHRLRGLGRRARDRLRGRAADPAPRCRGGRAARVRAARRAGPRPPCARRIGGQRVRRIVRRRSAVGGVPWRATLLARPARAGCHKVVTKSNSSLHSAAPPRPGMPGESVSRCRIRVQGWPVGGHFAMSDLCDPVHADRAR